MFELLKHPGRIAHLNIRTEKRGEEEVLAADVKVEADVTNDFLAYLAPTLKWSLYSKPDGGQGELIQDDSHMPRLRYPFLPEIRWADKMVDAVLVIHGKKKTDDLQFDAGVDKLCLECKEGGTVSISFRCSVLPTAAQAGQLAALLGQETKISVREGEAADTDDGDAKP